MVDEFENTIWVNIFPNNIYELLIKNENNELFNYHILNEEFELASAYATVRPPILFISHILVLDR